MLKGSITSISGNNPLSSPLLVRSLVSIPNFSKSSALFKKVAVPLVRALSLSAFMSSKAFMSPTKVAILVMVAVAPKASSSKAVFHSEPFL